MAFNTFYKLFFSSSKIRTKFRQIEYGGIKTLFVKFFSIWRKKATWRKFPPHSIWRNDGGTKKSFICFIFSFIMLLVKRYINFYYPNYYNSIAIWSIDIIKARFRTIFLQNNVINLKQSIFHRSSFSKRIVFYNIIIFSLYWNKKWL